MQEREGRPEADACASGFACSWSLPHPQQACRGGISPWKRAQAAALLTLCPRAALSPLHPPDTINLTPPLLALPRLAGQAPMLSVDNMEPAAAVATLRQALEGLNTLSAQRAALEEALKVRRVAGCWVGAWECGWLVGVGAGLPVDALQALLFPCTAATIAAQPLHTPCFSHKPAVLPQTAACFSNCPAH